MPRDRRYVEGRMIRRGTCCGARCVLAGWEACKGVSVNRAFHETPLHGPVRGHRIDSSCDADRVGACFGGGFVMRLVLVRGVPLLLS